MKIIGRADKKKTYTAIRFIKHTRKYKKISEKRIIRKTVIEYYIERYTKKIT